MLKELFDWLDDKKPVKEIVVEEQKIHSNPIYMDLISNAHIANIKCNMIKSISEGTPQSTKEISNEDKKEIINFYLNKIPDSLKKCITENKDYLYLFGTSLPSDMIAKYYRKYNIANYDNIFVRISSDLYTVLQDIGIKASLHTDKKAITIKVNDLKKFCNYEKLIALK